MKLALGWTLIQVNFDPIQEIGPKVGGGHAFVSVGSYTRLYGVITLIQRNNTDRVRTYYWPSLVTHKSHSFIHKYRVVKFIPRQGYDGKKCCMLQ